MLWWHFDLTLATSKAQICEWGPAALNTAHSENGPVFPLDLAHPVNSFQCFEPFHVPVQKGTQLELGPFSQTYSTRAPGLLLINKHLCTNLTNGHTALDLQSLWNRAEPNSLDCFRPELVTYLYQQLKILGCDTYFEGKSWISKQRYSLLNAEFIIKMTSF